MTRIKHTNVTAILLSVITLLVFGLSLQVSVPKANADTDQHHNANIENQNNLVTTDCAGDGCANENSPCASDCLSSTLEITRYNVALTTRSISIAHTSDNVTTNVYSRPPPQKYNHQYRHTNRVRILSTRKLE